VQQFSRITTLLSFDTCRFNSPRQEPSLTTVKFGQLIVAGVVVEAGAAVVVLAADVEAVAVPVTDVGAVLLRLVDAVRKVETASGCEAQFKSCRLQKQRWQQSTQRELHHLTLIVHIASWLVTARQLMMAPHNSTAEFDTA